MKFIFSKTTEAIRDAFGKRAIKKPTIQLKYPVLQDEGGEWRVHMLENARLFHDPRSFAVFNSDDALLSEFYCFMRPDLEINTYIGKSGHPRPTRSGGTTLSLYSPLSRRNYFHWLFDVLPRLYLFRKACPGVLPDHYLFPGPLDKPYREQTLDLMDVPRSQRLADARSIHWNCEKLYITDHPRNVTGHGQRSIKAWNCRFLRETFLPLTLSDKGFPRRIYISRSDAYTGGRQTTMDTELNDLLGRYNIETVVLGELPFLEQVSLFARAEFVMGVHGAGFANTVFCSPGTKVMEMYNEGFCPAYYVNIATLCGLEYIPLIQADMDPADRHRLGNVRINIPALEAKLALLFAD